MRPGLLCLALSACAISEGTGVVEGRFEVPGCHAGTDVRFDDFRFDVGFVANKRRGDFLEILMLEHGVDLEETDGLIVQFDSVVALRAARAAQAPASPLVIPLGRGASPARASLSLFVSCPRSPTLHVTSGTVSFTRLELAEDPADAGLDEVVTGSLTASVAGADVTRPLGSIRATFDFVPANAPQIGQGTQ